MSSESYRYLPGPLAEVGKLYVWSGAGLSSRFMTGNIKSIRRRQPLLCVAIDVHEALGGKLCKFIDREGMQFVLFVENCYLLSELNDEATDDNSVPV